MGPCSSIGGGDNQSALNDDDRLIQPKVVKRTLRPVGHPLGGRQWFSLIPPKWQSVLPTHWAGLKMGRKRHEDTQVFRSSRRQVSGDARECNRRALTDFLVGYCVS